MYADGLLMSLTYFYYHLKCLHHSFCYIYYLKRIIFIVIKIYYYFFSLAEFTQFIIALLFFKNKGSIKLVTITHILILYIVSLMMFSSNTCIVNYNLSFSL